MLCRECRAVAATKSALDVQVLFSRSKQAFINQVYNNWEQASQKLFHHEFGDSTTNPNAPAQKNHPGSSGKAKLREKSLGSQHQTTHMRWFSEAKKRRELDLTGGDIQTTLIVAGADASEQNRESIGVFMRTLLKLIQQRSSPVHRFAREVKFLNQIKLPAVQRLAARYKSKTAIEDFTSALHLTMLYGLYLELISACEEEEVISFSVLVDLASTYKTREWMAVCLRYVSTLSSEAEVCERVVKVVRMSSKTGEAITAAIAEVIEWFNDKMDELFEKCPFLFPANGPKKLSLANCSAFGSDGGGGVRSKYISANNRIKEFNARIKDWWCGAHRIQLASKRASQSNQFLAEHYEATKHLQQLLTMSAEVDMIFKRCQSALSGKPETASVSFSDTPMFKWETENDCLAKEAKLHRAIAHTVVEIRQGAKDANSRRFTTHHLAKLVVKPMRILYVGFKRDILNVAVQLLRKTEVTEIELTEFQVAVERALLHLNHLATNDGPMYKQAEADLRNGKYAEFQLEESENLEDIVSEADAQRTLAAESFKEQISTYLSTDKRTIFKGYEVLSMDRLVMNVDNEATLLSYGAESEEALAEFFCRPVQFKAQWTQPRGQVFTAAALSSEKELHEQLEDLKFQMYQFRNLPAEKRSTRKVLLRMLKTRIACVKGKPLIRRIIKSYLEIPLSTSGVECVFSAVRLTDTRLCLTRKDATVNKYKTTIMESEPFEGFDVDLAVTIWEKMRPRNIALSVGARASSAECSILRSMAKKAAGRLKKFEYRTQATLARPPDSNLTRTPADDEDDVIIEESDWFGATYAPFLGYYEEEIPNYDWSSDDEEFSGDPSERDCVAAAATAPGPSRVQQ